MTSVKSAWMKSMDKQRRGFEALPNSGSRKLPNCGSNSGSTFRKGVGGVVDRLQAVREAILAAKYNPSDYENEGEAVHCMAMEILSNRMNKEVVERRLLSVSDQIHRYHPMTTLEDNMRVEDQDVRKMVDILLRIRDRLNGAGLDCSMYSDEDDAVREIISRYKALKEQVSHGDF